MPTRSLACRCGGRIAGGGCNRCGRRTATPRPARTNNSTARGYDRQWRTLRAAKLRANPLCELCLTVDRVSPAAEVHHLRKFRRPDGTIDDALRLAFDNLQSLCPACHRSLTTRGL